MKKEQSIHLALNETDYFPRADFEQPTLNPNWKTVENVLPQEKFIIFFHVKIPMHVLLIKELSTHYPRQPAEIDQQIKKSVSEKKIKK